MHRIPRWMETTIDTNYFDNLRQNQKLNLVQHWNSFIDVDRILYKISFNAIIDRILPCKFYRFRFKLQGEFEK